MEKSQLKQQLTLLIYTYDEWISNHTVYFFIGKGGMLYSAVMLIMVVQSNLPQDSLPLPLWQGI